MLGMSSKVYEGIVAAFGMQPDSYVDLASISLMEGEDKESTILLRGDGTLVSVYEVQGNFKIFEGEEFEQYWEDIYDAFAPVVSGSGHRVQIVFSQDKDGVKRKLEDIVAPAKGNMKVSGMDFSWLLDSRVEVLEKWCVDERFWLVFESDVSWMSKEMLKQAQEDLKEVNKHNINLGKGSLSSLETIRTMYDRHMSARETLEKSLRRAGFYIFLMSAGEFLKSLRFSMEGEYTGRDWQPRLPGVSKPHWGILPKPVRYQLSSLMYPSIAKQVIATNIEFTDDIRVVKYGNRFYASVIVNMMPESPRAFEELADRLSEFKFNYQVSFRYQPSPPASYGIKGAIAGILGFASARNRQFNEAKMFLDEYMKNDGKVCALSITFLTYSKSEKEAVSNCQKIIQVLHNWGSTESSDAVGDPSLSFITAQPGLSSKDVAPKALGPTHEILRMSPLYRLSSPWKKGASLFRTETGKIMPYQPGSNLQASWSSICFAPPGQGKSVLLNSLLLSSIMNSKELPMIGILDIGPSSKGLVEMLQSSLRKDQKHLAVHMTVENAKEYTINIFDTLLGMDKPLPEHRATIISFISTLCTPAGKNMPPDGVTNLVSEVVGMMYNEFSRAGGRAKKMELGADREIQEFIEKRYPEILDYDGNATWWWLVDFLFKKGHVVMAGKAQRYAVPTLLDFASFATTQDISKTYGKISVNGQPLNDYVNSAVSAALKNYRLIGGATKFDIGNARIMAFDLQNVTSSSGAAGAKQTALMFSLFRYIVVRNYYLSADTLATSGMSENKATKPYYPYHLKQVQDMTSVPKILSMDEFHRTQGVDEFRAIIDRDIREGRKYGIQVLLFSQEPDDFSPVMQNFSTTKFILGAGEGTSTIEKLKKSFGLSDSAISMIRKITPPSSKGAQLYIKARTKFGESEMMVYNSLGPVEMWALETNAINRQLRKMVYDRFGVKRGLRALAKVFPSGSAVERIRAIEEASARSGQDIDPFVVAFEEVAKVVEEE